MPSSPWDFCGSKDRNNRSNLSGSMNRLSSVTLHLGAIGGRELLVSTVQHCVIKLLFKIVAFVLMFVTKSQFSNKGGIATKAFLLRILLKTDQ